MSVLRTVLSFRGLILAFGLLAVALPIALVGELGIVRKLNATNDAIASIREARLAASAALQYQLDVETATRGYAATGQKVFLSPYSSGRSEVPMRLNELRESLPADDARDRALVEDMRALSMRWESAVAEPLLAGSHDARVLLHGKALMDRFRADDKLLRDNLDADYAQDVSLRNQAIATTAAASFAAIVVVALEIIVFGAVIVRMRRELDRERGLVELLQVPTSVRLVRPAHLVIGTVYRSATRGARVGGDVYDVYQLDGDRTLLVVGDVSGKGLIAAVDTTFVRYAVRTLASEGLAPDAILLRFDALYRAAKPAPEAFVTLFVGIHDRRDATVAYANAGHEACWVRHAGQAALLAPTGPVVGIGGFPFGLAGAPLAAGDQLVLATDGLTEARDAQRRIVPIEQVAAWIREAPRGDPQRVADTLLAAATRYTRGRIDDDLAILVVQPLPGDGQ